MNDSEGILFDILKEGGYVVKIVQEPQFFWDVRECNDEGIEIFEYVEDYMRNNEEYYDPQIEYFCSFDSPGYEVHILSCAWLSENCVYLENIFVDRR